MAVALPLNGEPRNVREELVRRVQQAPAEHAEALLSSFAVLQALHDAGILELVKGALNSGDKILEIITRAANTPAAIRSIRNILILAKMVGSIEPELLEKFTLAIPEALEGAAKAEETKAPGFWGLMKIFRSSNLRHGLAVVNNLLEAWGKHFSGSASD